MPRPAFLIATGAALTTVTAGLLILRAPASREVPPAQRPPQSAAPAPTPSAPSPPAEALSLPAPVSPRARRTAPSPTVDEAPPSEPVETPSVAAASPARVGLTIHSDVPGAEIFIDRRFVGNAPVTISDLEPGQHRLNASADGFEGIARTIDVEPGAREMTIRFREVRLDVTMPIVHKHRIGSCAGRLVATIAGIRYETTNREDAFSVALTDIEAFDVDYQQRNLRLKLRRGREYNFTDPQRDADRLFVFHRDVERARGLLAKGYQPATD